MNGPSHHVITEIHQNYVAFIVSCEKCRTKLFEFTHQQRYDQPYLDVALRYYGKYGPPMSASSWFKPFVRVECTDEGHRFLPVAEGEDRCMIVTHRKMTEVDFKQWADEYAVPGEKDETSSTR